MKSFHGPLPALAVPGLASSRPASSNVSRIADSARARARFSGVATDSSFSTAGFRSVA